MADIHLDDVHNDLLRDDDESLQSLEMPEFIDHSEEVDEDRDIDNLFDLSPEIYGEEYANAPVALQDEEEADILADLLRTKGIDDPTAIDYEDASGNLQKVNFFELPYNEQLEILKSNDGDIDYGLSEGEVETLNFLRENGVSLEEAIEYFQRKAIEGHIDSQNIVGLEVDQYDDTELFALDLKSKYPDLTDDELQIELDKQLEHPDLFRKKIEQLRTDYKEIEANQLTEARLEKERQDESKRQEIEDNLVDTAMGIDELGGLSLDDNDRNEVLSFILERDMNGYSSFVKSLNSPQTLFEAAWFVTKGREAFNILHDYYKKEISNVSKTAFEKGRQASLKQDTQPAETQSTPRRSYRRPISAQPIKPLNSQGTMSINDIPID